MPVYYSFRFSCTPHGPSAKFLVENGQLKLISILFDLKSNNFEFVGVWFSLFLLFFPSLVHTMDELKLTGNSLKGSRPILSFDQVWEAL